MSKLFKELNRRMGEIENDPLGGASNLDEYLTKSRGARFIWGIFYREPALIEWKGDSLFEPNEFDIYFKKNFPVQFFFRDTLYYFILRKWWWLKAKWDIIDYWLRPRQKWLFKKIPNHWCDKVELIPLVIFESVIHFVEKEKAFEWINWDGDEDHKNASEVIKKVYRYAKIRREMKKRLDKCSKMWLYYERVINEYDIKYAIETIKIKNFLWT